MNATPLETPSGRIYYADAVNAEHWGIYESKEALMLGIIADPWVVGLKGHPATVVRFEQYEDALWLVYENCTKSGICDCTPSRVNSERKDAGLPLLTDDEFEAMETDSKDCERLEQVNYKLIEIGVIVK